MSGSSRHRRLAPTASKLRVSLSWPVLLLLCFSVLAGRLVEMLLLVALVLSHELAHLAVAAGLGCRATGLRLTPLGGVLEWGAESELVPAVEMTVALAGPLHHLLLISLAALAGPFSRALGPYWPFFLRANLSLALFNLLPIYPLDGGRVLRALLVQSRGFTAATRMGWRVGRRLSACLVFMGLIALLTGRGPFLCLAGVYLFLGRDEHHTYHFANYLRLQERKRARLGQPGGLPLRPVVVGSEARIWNSLSKYAHRHYLVFCVVDGRGGVMGWVSEEEALAAVARAGLNTRFAMLVSGREGVSNPLSNAFQNRSGSSAAKRPDRLGMGRGD